MSNTRAEKRAELAQKRASVAAFILNNTIDRNELERLSNAVWSGIFEEKTVNDKPLYSNDKMRETEFTKRFHQIETLTALQSTVNLRTYNLAVAQSEAESLRYEILSLLEEIRAANNEGPR